MPLGPCFSDIYFENPEMAELRCPVFVFQNLPGSNHLSVSFNESPGSPGHDLAGLPGLNICEFTCLSDAKAGLKSVIIGLATISIMP